MYAAVAAISPPRNRNENDSCRFLDSEREAATQSVNAPSIRAAMAGRNASVAAMNSNSGFVIVARKPKKRGPPEWRFAQGATCAIKTRYSFSKRRWRLNTGYSSGRT